MTVCKMTACHESFSILILNVWRKKEFAGIRDDPRDSVHKNVKQSVSKKTFFGNNLTPVGNQSALKILFQTFGHRYDGAWAKL